VTAVEAWAIVDKDGKVIEIHLDRGKGMPTVIVCAFDAWHNEGAPHTAVKGEWRPHDLAR
jgi:hypothetical protein